MPNYLDTEGVAFLWRKIKNINTNKFTYYSKTKEEWDSDITFLSEKNVLYIYSNFKIFSKNGQEEIYLPGLKIGDGKSYLIDLPFLNDFDNNIEKVLLDHISNNSIHISDQQRNFWNNKLNYELQNETLILNRQ